MDLHAPTLAAVVVAVVVSARLNPRAIKIVFACRLDLPSLRLELKYAFPVVLHADDDPSRLGCHVVIAWLNVPTFVSGRP
jgi:hypothetical protein